MYLTLRFYLAMSTVVLLVAGGYLYPPLFNMGMAILWILMVTVVAETVMLYSKRGVRAERECSERFSNGDDNPVHIRVENTFPFPLQLEVIDEIPPEFQRRDICLKARIGARNERHLSYLLRPVERGEYHFGLVRILGTTVLGLVQRRFSCSHPIAIKVYPSYRMLRQYELIAISSHLAERGIKRIRRVGHHTDFEQIKDYVKGDDYRTINWKASARRHQLMVNVYQDERSQHIYNVIDKGRVMQQAFADSSAHGRQKGMTLLDYAINASLVLSYIAIRKEDKAGLITFSDRFETFVPASRQSGHMQTLLETLYHQRTLFSETDFSALCANINKHINKRSLVVLYTNFMGMASLKRQLPYLRQIGRRHRLLVVFFEDTQLKDYIHSPVSNMEEQFRHVIAEKYAYEKRLIASTLKQNGILSLLTAPDALSANVINKYLELNSQ
ncbi:MAG: DUF58 domain-containing protein [Prevotella sp.]|nr:DUF58 domain-containing protein [Prevotella sp.]